MQLFHQPELDENSKQFSFDKEESKHIVKVLRKKEGDLLQVTNGKGLMMEAQITIADIKHCVANIVSSKLLPLPKYHLHMAVAPTKMNDRYEWFLEKATEIGVSEITPILCEHSERKVIKMERFEKVLQSAMKQSLQAYLPKLNPLVPLEDFIQQKFEGQLYVAHCEDTKRTSLKEALTPSEDVVILIGPEGDFSVKEIETALQHGFIPVTLGDTRLRTETAAIVACHSVTFVNES